MPFVPCAHESTGKPPDGAFPAGTMITPVTGMTSSSRFVDVYITRYTVPSMSGAFTFCALTISPASAGSLAGTA